MKKFLLFLSLPLIMAFVFTACTSKPNLDAQAVEALKQQSTVQPDTSGLAQFQAWKAQNELADVTDFNKPEQYAATPVKKAPQKIYKAPVRKSPIPTPQTRTPEPSPNTTTSSSDNTTAGTEQPGTISSESSETAKAPVKKGVSKAVKGAVIGGVVGAVGGAVINKDNRVVGAVIGGIIGAGGGYTIGRGMDKKSGRIDMMP
jgi:hypothetical protein